MSTIERLARGAAAGLAGTVVIHFAEMALNKSVPRSAARMRGDPGQYWVQTAEHALPEKVRQQVPDVVENVAAGSLGYFYGATWGALFSLIRPQSKSILTEGLILGLVCWAAGYLGWLPATKVMKPVWRQRPLQVANPIATHAAYGLATAGVSELLSHAVSD